MASACFEPLKILLCLHVVFYVFYGLFLLSFQLLSSCLSDFIKYNSVGSGKRSKKSVCTWLEVLRPATDKHPIESNSVKLHTSCTHMLLFTYGYHFVNKLILLIVGCDCFIEINMSKKELFRFNIKPDSNCVSDSIYHTFIECQFAKSFTQYVLQWFNVNNSSNFNLNAEDILFGLFSASNTLTKKLNYAIIFITVR